jgi:hypothetical protein
MALILLAATAMLALPNLFIGNATMITVDYPVVGTNKLTAGGGGACSYSYSAHDDIPVVTSAKCLISASDIDKGVYRSQPVALKQTQEVHCHVC